MQTRLGIKGLPSIAAAFVPGPEKAAAALRGSKLIELMEADGVGVVDHARSNVGARIGRLRPRRT